MKVAELDWFNLPLWLQVLMGIGLALLVLIVGALVVGVAWSRLRAMVESDSEQGEDRTQW